MGATQLAEITDVITAVLTPFGEDGAVDFGYMWRHLRLQEESGIAGIAPCGTNGEGQSLSLEERKAVIRFAVENKGSMFVLAGTGCVSLAETVELTRFAERVGADAALVLPSYFYKPSPTGLRDYFRRLFDEVAIPIMLYNIPSLTGVPITHELLRDLSDYPHLLGVKDTSSDPACTGSYVREFPNLKIFNGADLVIEKSLGVGAHGIISGTSNMLPDLVVSVYKAFREGGSVSELQQRLIEIRQVTDKYPPYASTKTILSLLGFPLTHVRPPLVNLTPEETAALREDMRRLGIIG